MKALLILCVLPLAVAIAIPAWRAPAPEWAGAGVMTTLALTIALAMMRWKRAGRGAAVARALGSSYAPLAASLVVIPVTLSTLYLFHGEKIGERGLSLIVGELALLQFAMGVACMSVPRNRFLGFRTSRTLADDESWRQANMRWGRRLAAASPLALAGLVAGQWGPLVAWLPAAVIGAAFLIADAR